MGAGISYEWRAIERRHRLLCLAMTGSTYMDPRHLEHFSYPLWNTEASHLIVMSGFRDLMVGPQFPIWTSAVEQPPINPDISTRTTADGSARGVAVDIAIFLPIVQPRLLRFFAAHEKLFKTLSLMGFINNVINGDANMPALPARCLWSNALWAPILMELKVPPRRHPRNLRDYVLVAHSRLKEAQLQSDQQGLCLFCSWRFLYQTVVFLLAITGDIWSVRCLTRTAAAAAYDGDELFNPTVLLDLKDDELEEEQDPPYTAEDWAKMITNPRLAVTNGEALMAQERAAQVQEREHLKAARPSGSAPAPNYDDYGLPLFSDAAIDAMSRTLPDQEDFWESKTPEEFFVGTEATEWSLALRLGTPLSDKYQRYLSRYLESATEAEVERRKKARFKPETTPTE